MISSSVVEVSNKMAYCVWILTKTKRGYQQTSIFTLPSHRSPAPTPFLPYIRRSPFTTLTVSPILPVGLHFPNSPFTSRSTSSTAIPSPTRRWTSPVLPPTHRSDFRSPLYPAFHHRTRLSAVPAVHTFRDVQLTFPPQSTNTVDLLSRFSESRLLEVPFRPSRCAIVKFVSTLCTEFFFKYVSLYPQVSCRHTVLPFSCFIGVGLLLRFKWEGRF